MDDSLFRSTGYVSQSEVLASDGRRWDLALLPPFLRTLLVTDGTVTKSLEAYFWEPVQVERVCQEERAAAECAVPQYLSAAISPRWLLREVALIGHSSRRCFACARSWLALAALPQPLASGILAGGIGIGELLRAQGVETYREIVALDFLQSGGEDPLLPAESGPWVARAYRIRVGGVPAILVTEYFPLALYTTVEA